MTRSWTRQGTARAERVRSGSRWLVIVSLGAAVILAVPAGAISILKAFPGNPTDGAFPACQLIGDGAGNLYGTTYSGGPLDMGTVFTVRTDGSGYAVLHYFNGGTADGESPTESLVLDGAGNLYGTTYLGGESDKGTVFTVRTDGAGFALMHSFTGAPSDGAYPYSGLTPGNGDNLYGTTARGGGFDGGILYRVNTNGTGYALLHDFNPASNGGGSEPEAALAFDGADNLYGTTTWGGEASYGTVFTIRTDGAGFAALHDFDGWGIVDVLPGPLVVDSAGNLFGTTQTDGASQAGTVFTLRSNGTGFTVLHTFAGGSADGATPLGRLALDGSGALYGTTRYGGPSGSGTVFSLGTDGTGYTVLRDFAGGASDGAYPGAGLILDGAGNLYGTSQGGGASNAGAVFTIKSSGTAFALLRSFAGSPPDGAHPSAGVVVDGAGNLYGTTPGGGVTNGGTVFTVRTDGSCFALLHEFSTEGPDGASPYGRLVLDAGGNLYGTTSGGGASGKGTVFTLKTNGDGFAVLHTFAGGVADGARPHAGLVLDADGHLYGTTYGGGASDQGTVFTVKTDGGGFTVLHGFAGHPTDGERPMDAPLVLDGAGNLYGTTFNGGALDHGTVFKLGTNGTGFTALWYFDGVVRYPWGDWRSTAPAACTEQRVTGAPMATARCSESARTGAGSRRFTRSGTTFPAERTPSPSWS